MTPCEKLGYKVGDKFEVVDEHYAFPRGAIITLILDDGSSAPIFEGERTDNETSGCCLLFKVKPVSQRATKPISKSKRQLAQLLIEAGVTQFPEGANWAAQDKDDSSVWFQRSGDAPKRGSGNDYWCGCKEKSVHLPTLIPNWHQTVLSRDEFDQIVAETVVPSESPMTEDERCIQEAFVPESVATPTLDQLLQDWRNADDYAQRKQLEADEAAALRDERWQAVQARAGEMGVTVGRCENVATADDGGWVEWNGGKQPVKDGTMVVLKMRSGYLWKDGEPSPAERMYWVHDDDGSDIVAYRLARP